MIPTPYRELNEVLDELVSRLVERLGYKLIGVYLQGSFALGDFDEHSDADLIVVLENELSSCIFRRMLDTDSGACWTPIPTDAGHRFRSMVDNQVNS